jgi:hypothetical protein
VLDRVQSDRSRTVDWCLKEAGDRVELPMKEFPGGFTAKPDDTAHNTLFGSKLHSDRHFAAAADEIWTEGQGRLMMAAEKGTRVYGFRVPASFSSGKAGRAGVPVLMARRSAVQRTDFVTYFSGRTKSVERMPVMTTDGGEADALGARITLKNGKVIQALVNHKPGTEVRLGTLVTKELFATDYVE